jgi:iron-sulfur cluster repair protein YtfE (RIC family)
MAIEAPSQVELDTLALAQRSGWPDDLRVLIERYPRDCWSGHANLGAMAQFWLQRHDMFRELATGLNDATQRFREGSMPVADYPRWFVPRLQFFLEQLTAHHQIEDHHYFPVFSAADGRLKRGFAVLEADHQILHANIVRSVDTANAMLRALSGDADTLRTCGDDYAAVSGDLLNGLMRHLEDEEDLIVPLILDRGEDALGVGH